MEPSFSHRFGYARWLKHLRDGEEPSNAAIGRALPAANGRTRTGQGVGKMGRKDKPPKDWEVHEPLARMLGVDSDWLIKDKGEPPEPDLWKVWLRYRRADPVGVRKTKTQLTRADVDQKKRKRS